MRIVTITIKYPSNMFSKFTLSDITRAMRIAFPFIEVLSVRDMPEHVYEAEKSNQ